MLIADIPQCGGSPRPRQRIGSLCLLLGLHGALLVAASSCSKGGAMDNVTCLTIADATKAVEPNPLPASLYAELRGSTGVVIGIPLDGAGGVYSGSRAFTKCDATDTYTVERISLVDVRGSAVATAVRSSSSYVVTYAGGGSTTASGAGLTNLSVSFSGMAPATTKLTSLTASPAMVRQGEKLNIQVAFQDDTCGIKESQWWLASSTVSSMATPPVTIAGPMGSATLTVPPSQSAGTYYVEGLVTLRDGGRRFNVRRQVAGDSTYKLIDSRGATDQMIPVVSAAVAENPDVDRMAPAALRMDANPASVGRCQNVSLSLVLSDNKAALGGQIVPVHVGPQDRPNLLSTFVTGGESLYGSFTVPIDAPGGVWYAYPDKIRDAAGNESTASFSGGKFTLSGPGLMAPAVNAATFIVPNNTVTLPDLAMPNLDLAAAPDLAPPPDLAKPYPAILAGVRVDPSSIAKDGDPVRVDITWTDVAGILK